MRKGTKLVIIGLLTFASGVSWLYVSSQPIIPYPKVDPDADVITFKGKSEEAPCKDMLFSESLYPGCEDIQEKSAMISCLDNEISSREYQLKSLNDNLAELRGERAELALINKQSLKKILELLNQNQAATITLSAIIGAFVSSLVSLLLEADWQKVYKKIINSLSD